ncbi:MAG: DUF1849 family protein [Rhodospirillaceae bacterium]|nr:DUF1849 family protein [Rhodospirillaceae bacterium]
MPKRVIALAALAMLAVPAARAEDAADKVWMKIQPARGVFVLRQSNAANDNGALLTGRMIAEARLTCTDMTTTMTMELRATSGAQSMTVMLEQKSTETRDGKVYRYSSRTLENGTVTESREGQAVLETRDGPGEAKIKGGHIEDVKLTAGTILPGTHILRVMAAAAEGKTALEHRVFYGLDQMRIVNVKVTIKGKGKSEKARGLGEFSEKPGWTIREEQRENGNAAGTTQASEMFVTEDGVATHITMSVQGLELVGTPLSIEKLPKPDCKS